MIPRINIEPAITPTKIAPNYTIGFIFINYSQICINFIKVEKNIEVDFD
jgi:hypothetical protein